MVIKQRGELMHQVGVAELKKRLSEYLARVSAGEEIVVASRGKPVARLVPPRLHGADEEERRLLDLQRRGLVRLGTGKIPKEFWTLERAQDPDGRVRAALREERDEGW
jgi:prevent-host-death family protein